MYTQFVYPFICHWKFEFASISDCYKSSYKYSCKSLFLCRHVLSFAVSKWKGMEQQCHVIYECLTFEIAAKQCSIMVAPFCILTNLMYESSSCSMSLTIFGIVNLFNFDYIPKYLSISTYTLIYRKAGSLFGKNLELHLSFPFRLIYGIRQNAPLEKNVS